MRLAEISTIKPQKSLTPAKARIATKQRQVDQAREALKREREYQTRRSELEKEWKAQRTR